MIADLKPYAEYKESGLGWIGAVPQHWGLLPNRAIFAEVNERNHPEEEMLSVTITQGVIKQKALLSGSSKKDSSNQDKSAYKLVCPRDIAYNKMRAWQGAIGISDLRGIISPAYVVVRLRAAHEARYFHHLFRTPHFAKEAERWSYGITSDMWSLRPEHFKMIYSPLPPPDEQAAIVRFLDYTNRRLERTIRAKRKIIALLNEQKQAIIHRAVTRGLDPNVPLKPSGIAWLGEIPAHWEVVKIGQKAQIVRGRFSHRPRNDPQFYGGAYPFIQTGDISAAEQQITSYTQTLNEAGYKISKLFKAGTLAMVITGAKTGHVAILGFDACFPDSAVGFVPNKDVDKTFLYFAFIALKGELDRASITSTQENLNVQRIRSQVTTWPPLKEQVNIVRHLDSELAKLAAVITWTKREIELLREYRTRLIADVVTGKLDVRGVAATLPDEIDEPEMLAADEALDESEELADDEIEAGDE